MRYFARTPPTASGAHPLSSTEIREGLLATVRNRRGIITSVQAAKPTTSEPRTLHLVTVEYLDTDGVAQETLLWEREEAAGAKLTQPRTLPNVAGHLPMPRAEFDAMLRSARWAALTPFVRPDGSAAEMPLAAPFHGGIQVEEFQLVPLLKALQMPRISLLIADDVGLGKTVEAGLILSELLIRRRVRRVLILCPASLRTQWQQELHDKFSLSFDMIDRAESVGLQRRLGPDANAWRAFPRAIASYHYLRQPDVREQFLSTCRTQEALAGHAAQLPWDLLIVDEAHNLMPSSFGPDSDLAETLRLITPWFEHKLFLSATPHNGHTRSFSGLLEALDPVRFTQTNQFTPEQKLRVQDVVVRRLKREINALDEAADRPPRFPKRHLRGVSVGLHRPEQALSRAVGVFRAKVKEILAIQGGHFHAGFFAIEILNKRLLSCPFTFAESWSRFRLGMESGEGGDDKDLSAATRGAREETESDQENSTRAAHAAKTVGAWLHEYRDILASSIDGVDAALAALDLGTGAVPKVDARVEGLLGVINERVRQDGGWHANERLIIFTEYKTTLEYLDKRLRSAFKDDGRAIRVLFGGMPGRDEVKAAFNDPSDAVRVLIATDAASEGLNLQETARFLFHFEIPWNPSRLEQRNGRIDRHGQPRDVTVFHFTSDDDADLKFVAHVLRKVDEIREDLGGMGEVFEAAFQRRFQALEDAEDVVVKLDRAVKAVKERGTEDMPPPLVLVDESERLRALAVDVDLSPETLQSTLAVALGGSAFDEPDAENRWRLNGGWSPEWQPVMDDSVRLSNRELPKVIFDSKLFLRQVGKRQVFRPEKGVLLVHLGHPLMQFASSLFARRRLSTEDRPASRWTVRSGDVPEGADALVLVSVEEMALNELREAFHLTVRTLAFSVRGGRLTRLPHQVPALVLPAGQELVPRWTEGNPLLTPARDVWADVDIDLREALGSHGRELKKAISVALATARKKAEVGTKEQFQKRIGEVEKAMAENTLAKLQKEHDKALLAIEQNPFLPEATKRALEEAARNLDDEITRRRGRYDELLKLLRREQDRVVAKILPGRYTMRGDVQVLPVGVEILLPVSGRTGAT